MSEEFLDASEFEKEEDLKGFSYPAEGWFHCVVNTIDTSREKNKGVKFEGHVLAGTVDGQKGQTWPETLWDPSPDHKDGGKFARKRLASFALATGLMQANQLGQQVAIDWDAAAGRQFVAKLVHYERKNAEGKVFKGAEVDGTEFYPVNHADVSQVPKDPIALGMLGQTAPAAPAATGPPPTAAPASAAPQQTAEQQQVPAPAPAASGKSALDYSKF